MTCVALFEDNVFRASLASSAHNSFHLGQGFELQRSSEVTDYTDVLVYRKQRPAARLKLRGRGGSLDLATMKTQTMRPHKSLIDPTVIKFIGTGLLNTAFGYGAYTLLLYVGLPYLLALLASTVAGIVFNYFSFGHLVFSKDKSWPMFGRFVITYAFIYCVNAVLLRLLTDHFLISPYLGQIICIPISVALSWLAMNHWVYRKER